jgi:hypothetical protein
LIQQNQESVGSDYTTSHNLVPVFPHRNFAIRFLSAFAGTHSALSKLNLPCIVAVTSLFRIAHEKIPVAVPRFAQRRFR